MAFLDLLQSGSHEFETFNEDEQYTRYTIRHEASSFELLVPEHLPEYELHALKRQSGTLVFFGRKRAKKHEGMLLIAQQLHPSTYRAFLAHDIYPETLAAIPPTPEWELGST